MAKHLQVELTGGLAGSATEGVSMELFGNFALRLREAYRRSAQAVLTGSYQDHGRLPDRVADLDVRLLSASAGSLHLEAAPYDQRAAYQSALFHDSLAEDALDRMFTGIAEATSNADDRTVPRALKALLATSPADVRQKYRLVDGTQILREIEVTSEGIVLAGDPVIAGIKRSVVSVVGLLFSPRPNVSLKIEGVVIRATATEQLIQRAIDLRDRTDIIATVVTTTTGHRLLDLSPVDVVFPRRTPEVRETLERFSDVMAVLAR